VNKKYVAWVSVVLYSILIFIGSSIPGDQVDLKGPGFDKLLHAIEYSILSLLLFNALRYNGKIGIRTVFWTTAIVSSVYGLSDEVHQLFVPLREFDVIDIICDMSGSILGAYAMFRLSNNKRRPLLNLDK